MGLISIGGRIIDEATGQPPVDAQGNPSVSQPQSPFSTDYLNANAAKIQANPFNPGTREYSDFQKSQIQSMKDMAGAPVRPEFQSMIDKDTGLLNSNLTAQAHTVDPSTIGQVNFQSALDPMQARLDQVQLNKNPLQALEQEGLRTGPSAWSGLMKQQIDQQKLADLDKVGAQANGANATAESSLAMRGGLGTGARTSLAKDLQRGINSNSQNVRRGATNDALNVDIQDENKRIGILSQLPGMELQALQPDLQKAQDLNAAQLTEQGRNLDTQKANIDSAANLAKYNADASTTADKYNIGNALNEKLQERGFDMGAYLETMKNFAAGKQGDAIAGSGKGK